MIKRSKTWINGLSLIHGLLFVSGIGTLCSCSDFLEITPQETIVLEAQMSYLCREDCAGLCPRCGKDLNEGPCDCPPEVVRTLAPSRRISSISRSS